MVTTAVRPSDELMAVGVMTSPSSPCFSTTVPSNGAYRCIVAIVALISWMLAFVSLTAASRAATRAAAFLCPAIAFSYSSGVALFWANSRRHAPFLALLLPQSARASSSSAAVLQHLGLARGQHRLQVVVLDDGERVALLDLHPLLDAHLLDPARRSWCRSSPGSATSDIPWRRAASRLHPCHPLDQADVTSGRDRIWSYWR